MINSAIFSGLPQSLGEVHPHNTSDKNFSIFYFWPCAWAGWRATIILGNYNLKSKGAEKMSKNKEYIPVATSETVYYEPQTQAEFEEMTAIMKVGDMIYSKWVFSGLWYTMGLNDENDLETMCLFPNIIMDEPLPQLTRWGLARYDYLKSERKFMAAQFGLIGLHKHCLEVEKQAEERKRSMMAAIRKDPKNKVMESDKAQNPMEWVGRMNNFQAQVHEVIYADLIYA